MVSPSAGSHWGGAANAEKKRVMLSAFTDVQEVLFTVAERNVRSRAVEKRGAELAEAEDGCRHYRYTALFKHGWIDVLTKKIHNVISVGQNCSHWSTVNNEPFGDKRAGSIREETTELTILLIATIPAKITNDTFNFQWTASPGIVHVGCVQSI
jgi:hypothetical protein